MRGERRKKMIELRNYSTRTAWKKRRKIEARKKSWRIETRKRKEMGRWKTMRKGECRLWWQRG